MKILIDEAAIQLAITMLKTGSPEYDVRDVIDLLQASIEHLGARDIPKPGCKECAEYNDTIRSNIEWLADLAKGRKLVAEQAKIYTTGHCVNHNGPRGCQLHNLQCGYPNCDRKYNE